MKEVIIENYMDMLHKASQRVKKVAKTMDYEDILSEATYLFYRAKKKFDVNKGAFSTILTYHLKNLMKNCVTGYAIPFSKAFDPYTKEIFFDAFHCSIVYEHDDSINNGRKGLPIEELSKEQIFVLEVIKEVDEDNGALSLFGDKMINNIAIKKVVGCLRKKTEWSLAKCEEVLESLKHWYLNTSVVAI